MGDDRKNTIAFRLKQLRKSRSMTQRQLADEINISYGSIVDYENGRREPNSKAMAALESYFNVSGAYLRGAPATSILSTYATNCLRTATAGATFARQQELPEQIASSPLKERRKTVHELIDKMSNEEFEKVWKFLQWTDLLQESN